MPEIYSLTSLLVPITVAATPHFCLYFPILQLATFSTLLLVTFYFQHRANSHLPGLHLSMLFHTGPSAVLSNIGLYHLCHDVCTFLILEHQLLCCSWIFLSLDTTYYIVLVSPPNKIDLPQICPALSTSPPSASRFSSPNSYLFIR